MINLKFGLSPSGQILYNKKKSILIGLNFLLSGPTTDFWKLKVFIRWVQRLTNKERKAYTFLYFLYVIGIWLTK